MDISLVLLLILALLLFAYISRSPWKRLPPGPINFPVIGSLPYLGGDPRVVFARLASKYGDVFTIYLGPVRVVVLNGYDLIKECLQKNGAHFEDRSHLWDDFDTPGIASTSGQLWRDHRRYGQHFLRTFGSGGGLTLEDIITNELTHLVANMESTIGMPCQIKDILFRAIGNIIATITTNQRYQYDDESFGSFLNAIFEYTANIGPNNPALLFNILRYLPGDLFKYQKAKSLNLFINTRIAAWITEHRKTPDSHDNDFLDNYLDEMGRKPDNPLFSDKRLNAIVSEFFGAGTDTTAGTLTWGVLYMVLSPDIQVKVQYEIDEVIGSSGQPSMQHCKHMPYTQAVISEIQRLADMLPLSVPRATTEDTEIRGYSIPKGTMVISNMHSIHADPKLWPDPEKFDPGRFLDADGKYMKREELVPFSLGKRSCLGENLARMQLFLFFTTMLQNFTFSVPDNQSPPSTESMLGLANHPKPFDVVINRRK